MAEHETAAATIRRPEKMSVSLCRSQSFEKEDHSSVAAVQTHQDGDTLSLGSMKSATAGHSNLSDVAAFAPEVTHQAASSTSTSTTVPLETGEELPIKKHTRVFRVLRWIWLTTYHRLCLLVLLPNVIVLAILATQHDLFKIPLQHMATAVAANTAAAILIRQELVINLLFSLVAKTPRHVPLRIRRLLAKIYHLGGVHSGAGIAATIWFTFFNAVLLWRWKTNAITDLRGAETKLSFVVAVTIIIDLLLVVIVAMAHPELRRRFHNTFEASHRFAGWLAVLLFWFHLVILTDLLEESRQPRRPLGTALLRSPAVYLLIVSTVSLILPWLRLRRVPLQVEVLSNHASRWHFRYTNLDLCSASRVTDRPLMEWHSFAGIPERDGNGFSVIVSNAGDWTNRMITNPPRKLWVRGIPTFGVLHVAQIFNKLVLVATGSGIGPILSLLSARNVPCRILWSARDPIRTYSKDIIDEVFLADPAAMVFDTRVVDRNNRPDLIRLTYGLYRESNAEAVFVISNQKVTEKLVYGLESRGVPTFAPIFDS